MLISNSKPAIYQVLHDRFGVEWDKGIIITYGDTVYCKNDIAEDFKVHEFTHVTQQKEIGPIEWWKKYLDDPDFRLRMEVEAYRNQVKYIREHTESTTRDWRRDRIDSLAQSLSSFVYGNLVTYQKALDLIK